MNRLLWALSACGAARLGYGVFADDLTEIDRVLAGTALVCIALIFGINALLNDKTWWRVSK